MTKATKPVRRETFSSIRDHAKLLPIVVEIHATFIRVRLKGWRRFYTVTHDQIFMLGARNEAEAKRREKLEKRKGLK